MAKTSTKPVPLPTGNRRTQIESLATRALGNILQGCEALEDSAWVPAQLLAAEVRRDLDQLRNEGLGIFTFPAVKGDDGEPIAILGVAGLAPLARVAIGLLSRFGRPALGRIAQVARAGLAKLRKLPPVPAPGAPLPAGAPLPKIPAGKARDLAKSLWEKSLSLAKAAAALWVIKDVAKAGVEAAAPAIGAGVGSGLKWGLAAAGLVGGLVLFGGKRRKRKAGNGG